MKPISLPLLANSQCSETETNSLLKALLAADTGALEQWLIAHPLDAVTVQWLINQRLGPFLYFQLRRRDLLQYLPASLWPSLERSYYLTSIQHALLSGELQAVLMQLRAAGIEPIVLKGMALASEVYPSPATRPLSDLDLLVTETQVSTVQSALHALGYIGSGQQTERFMDLHQEANYWRELAGGQRLLVEVHWHLFVEPRYRALNISDVMDRARPLDIGGCVCRALDPADQLIYACGHLMLKHNRDVSLLWLLDLRLLVECYGAQWNWPGIVQRARHMRLAGALRYCLALAEDRFGVFLPDPACAALETVEPAPEELWYITVAKNPRQPMTSLLLGRLRQFQSPLQAVRYLWMLLFPPWAYIRQRYSASSIWLAPLYYGRRLLSGVKLALFRRE